MSPRLSLLVLATAPLQASAHLNVLANPLTLPRQSMRASPSLALVVGDSAAGELLVDGGLNFLSLYGGIITFRILLSWVPQAQGVSLLRPIFTISDVYLNLFRGVIPAIGGLDISPIAAFFVLNLLTNSVASLGAPMSAAQRPRRDVDSRLRNALLRARGLPASA